MIELDEIREGLARGEFFLEYLPSISLLDGRCLGAEALIRWRRPSGVISPEQIVPLVENTPLSGPLTYWVIENVQTELGCWLREHSDAHIGINVPPEILGRGGLAYAAAKSGLGAVASQIILEITERGFPDALGVQSINDYQGRVALDDVTLVGGANLAVLARCNFYAIKLDRSLVKQISPQYPEPEWLASVTALLDSSRLLVVAEGVETAYQVARLREANIQVAQGFFFSTPLPAESFKAFYDRYTTPPTDAPYFALEIWNT